MFAPLCMRHQGMQRTEGKLLRHSKLIARRHKQAGIMLGEGPTSSRQLSKGAHLGILVVAVFIYIRAASLAQRRIKLPVGLPVG